MAKWIEQNYKIGQVIQAPHPRDNGWQSAEITTLTVDRINHPFTRCANGIMVKFQDGTFMEIDQAYLYEDGSGM